MIGEKRGTLLTHLTKRRIPHNNRSIGRSGNAKDTRLDAHAPEFLPFSKFFLDFPYFFSVNVHNMNVHSMNMFDFSY